MEFLTHLPFIYDVATSNQNWTCALDHIADLVQSKGIALFASNNTNFVYNIVETNSFFNGFPEEVSHYLQTYKQYDDEAIARSFKLPVFKFYSDLEIWGEEVILKGREDLDYLIRAFGVHRRFVINLSIVSGCNALIATHYPTGTQGFEPAWQRDAPAIAVHLAKALEINRFCSQLRQRYNAVLTVLDKIDVALCVVLPSGEVLLQNRRARQIFEKADGIAVTRTNYLRLRSEDLTAMVRSYIGDCSATAAGQADRVERIVKVPKRSLADPYLIEISPLRDGDNELNEKLAGALMLIIDPDNPPALSVEAMARLHDLTRAEADVTRLLLDGRTLPEIADIRGVSPNTVRNQSRAIHIKLDVSNRAELIRKVTGISPPIAV